MILFHLPASLAALFDRGEETLSRYESSAERVFGGITIAMIRNNKDRKLRIKVHVLLVTGTVASYPVRA